MAEATISSIGEQRQSDAPRQSVRRRSAIRLLEQFHVLVEQHRRRSADRRLRHGHAHLDGRHQARHDHRQRREVTQSTASRPPNADFEVVLGFNADNTASDGTGLVEVGTAVTTGGGAEGKRFRHYPLRRRRFVSRCLRGENRRRRHRRDQQQSEQRRSSAPDPDPTSSIARLAVYGNGIELVDRSGGAGDDGRQSQSVLHGGHRFGFDPQGTNAKQSRPFPTTPRP